MDQPHLSKSVPQRHMCDWDWISEGIKHRVWHEEGAQQMPCRLRLHPSLECSPPWTSQTQAPCFAHTGHVQAGGAGELGGTWLNLATFQITMERGLGLFGPVPGLLVTPWPSPEPGSVSDSSSSPFCNSPARLPPWTFLFFPVPLLARMYRQVSPVWIQGWGEGSQASYIMWWYTVFLPS